MRGVSIIVPARNEQDTIKQTLEGIFSKITFKNFEVIIVNDNSTDRTFETATGFKNKYKNLKVINNEKKGFGTALMTGFKNAGYDYVVPVMADLCDEVSDINKMFELTKDYDIICGSRYMKAGKVVLAVPFKGNVSKFTGLLFNRIIGLPTKDATNAFKMYKKEIFDKIKIDNDNFSISLEIPVKAYFAGYKITEIPTKWTGRKVGKSKFKFLNQAPKYFSIFMWALKKKLKM